MSRKLPIVMLLLALASGVAGQPAAVSAAVGATSGLPCNGCHGMPPIDSDLRDAGTGTFAGNHSTHNPFLATPGSCEKCHPGSSTYTSDHRDWLIGVASNLNDSPHPAGASYDKPPFFNQTSVPALRSCSNVNCHFESTTPVWGSSPTETSCTSCHGAPPADGSHVSHAAHYGGEHSCSQCHSATETFSHATSIGKRPLAIRFDGISNWGGSYSGEIAYPNFLPSRNPSRNGVCRDLYCHSNGEPSSGTHYAEPVWGGALSAGCTGCHGGNGASVKPMDTGSHGAHIGRPIVAGAVSPCGQCHSETVTSGDDRIVTGTTSHVDGNKTVVFSDGGSYSVADKTCSSTRCHSGGKTGSGKLPPAWGGAAMGCNGCHGSSASGAPDYPSAGGGTHLANSHPIHTTSGPDSCNACHADTTATGTAINPESVLHLNGKIDVTFNTAKAGNGARWLGAIKACSGIECHGAGSAAVSWGGTSCLSCHSIPQGNRLGIAPQFDSGSHHIQGSVTDRACYQCHWEANSDGTVNKEFHGGSTTRGAPVDLVLYGAGSRPAVHRPGTSGIAYVPDGTRASVEQVTSHCLGCHRDENNGTEPFADGRTPNVYAWDGSSVAARYSQQGKTVWGKYSTVNGANKRTTKSYSAHGNAVANQRGWREDVGVDGVIPDLGGSVNVQCYDCHNSHGSEAVGITSRYSSATGRGGGGILKSTRAGKGGYAVTYRPYTTGNMADRNRLNPGGSLCLDCHLSSRAVTTPWGFDDTFRSTAPILGYADAFRYRQYSAAGTAKRYAYKGMHKASGGHFGASSVLSEAPRGTIGGLCTPCHDPHGLSPGLEGNKQFAVPLLKGTWITSPYREDVAPSFNNYLTNRPDMGDERGVKYNIDQNTFGSSLAGSPPAEGPKDAATFAGLCLGCHPRESLTNGTTHDWKSKDRIHESVSGWKTANKTVKHNYSCSKCHAPHTNSTLPRLMVTNCLDSMHKGRVGYGAATISGSGWGYAPRISPDPGPCEGVAVIYGFCKVRDLSILGGSGGGRIPGSWKGRAFGDFSVACHESQTGSGTDQRWNEVTPWFSYPRLLATTPSAAVVNCRPTVSWYANVPATSLIEYGPTTAYGSSVVGGLAEGNHSVILPMCVNPDGITFHYRVKTIGVDGQTYVSKDLDYDRQKPLVTEFSVPSQWSVDFAIPVTLFAATDQDRVTGYQITTSSTPPYAGTSDWSATPPASFTVYGFGSYSLYPWVKDASGNVSAAGMQRTVNVVDLASPTRPENLSPADNAAELLITTPVSSTVSTDTRSGPVQYYFEVAANSSFTGTVQSSGWVSGTSYAPVLVPGTTYYWHVKARDAATIPNETPFSTTWTFTTAAASSVVWTTKGDLETNARTTSTPTIRQRVRISGTAPADNGNVTLAFTSVAVSGTYHSLALKKDGTVWAWGLNGNGQLGNGNTVSSGSPVRVSGLTDVVSVATGNAHSLALKSDGTVWAWGRNINGQLGNNSFTDSKVPIQVQGLSGIVAIAAGGEHCLALTSSGSIMAWGYGYNGQLGTGSTTTHKIPTMVSGMYDAVAIAAGSSYSLAVRSNGSVWGWGANGDYQLGDGTRFDRLLPVAAQGALTGVVAVSAGQSHSLALASDGTVYGWGNNSSGQAGDSGYRIVSPTAISGLGGVSFVAAGTAYSVVVKGDGTVWAWGDNSNGKLGNGGTEASSVPGKVAGVAGVLTAAAGQGHVLVMKENGEVWSWGSNDCGQLGFGGLSSNFVPVQASPSTGLNGPVSVAGGFDFSLALNVDGTVWAWGDNQLGQLGDGTTIKRTIPARIETLTGATAVAAGEYHAVALKSDGSVWTWGSNSYGQLGDGTTIVRPSPVQVSGLSGVTAVAAGGNTTLALKSDGSVWAWGSNVVGQLGDGTAIDRGRPVQVSGLTGVMYIDAGAYHSLAVKRDGSVWAWGSNYFYQLGNGSAENSLVPVAVSGITGISKVAAGSYHSLAVMADGSVWGWGHNFYGQIGDGTVTQRPTPVKLTGLSGVMAVGTGETHSVALTADGAVWTWGSNSEGQLGEFTTSDRRSPARVTNMTSVRAIAAGHYFTLAAKSDGTLWGWGMDAQSQLGDGYQFSSLFPGPSSAAGGGAFTGTLSGLRFNAGSVVSWGSLFWSGATPGGSSIRLRTRGASTEDGLSSAAWSPFYAASGSSIVTPPSSWLEVELSESQGGILSPRLDEVLITY